MNYTKIYDQIIYNAKNRATLNTYTEEHHIIPKCMNGSNHYTNLISLTAKEHYVCHHILTKIYPKHTGIRYAFWCMLTCSKSLGRNYKITSKIYEKIKNQISVETGNRFRNSIPWNKGIPCSSDTKEKISLSHISSPTTEKQLSAVLAMNMAWKGQHHTKEAKQKISEGNKGKILSTEHRIQISVNAKRYAGSNNPMYGKRHTKEAKQKVSIANTGRIVSTETREKLSLASKNRQSSMLGKHHTAETKLKMSQKRGGSNNANAKRVKVLDINNNEYIFNCCKDMITWRRKNKIKIKSYEILGFTNKVN